MKFIYSLFLGTYFGVVLTKSQVISWFKIRDMFYFRSPDLYLIIGSAVVVGAISIFLLKKFKIKDPDGVQIDPPGKPFSKGLFIGGAIFGMGWFITGTCPGPIFAQIGTGEVMALFTFVGALLGTYVYGLLKPRLPH